MSPSKTSAKTKVCEFNMAISINQYIIWLDVSMYKTHFMNTLHSTSQFSNIKPKVNNNKNKNLNKNHRLVNTKLT